MKKIIFIAVLLSSLSFSDSLKLGNTYFHDNGTYSLDNSRFYDNKHGKQLIKANSKHDVIEIKSKKETHKKTFFSFLLDW